MIKTTFQLYQKAKGALERMKFRICDALGVDFTEINDRNGRFLRNIALDRDKFSQDGVPHCRYFIPKSDFDILENVTYREMSKFFNSPTFLRVILNHVFFRTFSVFISCLLI